ncbi:aldo/keto reductase [Chamaesiphon minutus]|uniref:Putative oxidoreductase, aryl-alcohol dehydrogenase like protein n=1 Tax=Chamaesiphon minutus (strain ATCC 27169 / PCC 6605) TaxID=1173020 RepID=K9U8L3_CHAP6|nr:aldo/keto reductase [Chamaesiphon minutus]AFY91417.1 putative oxidoreductase, aryl-alcohol dehydrogenase like protein [Chamaesiphon minutus PCC 6605]
MQTRKLGDKGLVVSALGLGCMGMSGVYGVADEAEAIATIHRAIDLGVNFLDTADAYGKGHNETLIGKAIGDRREKVVIATKFGLSDVSTGGYTIPVNGRPEYVRSACEASLRRLEVETIDLYYQHRVDPNTPIEDTVGTMAELVKEGKVRFLGLSEASAATIRRAHAVHPIAALQSEYSLWSRDVEDEILPTCRELQIGFVPWSPLGRGFLTGEIKTFDDLEPNDWRRTSPRFQGDNFGRNLDLVAQVQQMAREKKCTPAQLAIAWLLQQGEDIVPIPGTKRVSYLLDNLGALDIKLTDAELDRIDAILPKGAASGDRYPTAMMQMVNL